MLPTGLGLQSPGLVAAGATIPIVEFVIAAGVPLVTGIACAYHGLRLLKRARARRYPQRGDPVLAWLLLRVAFGVGACFGVSLFV